MKRQCGLTVVLSKRISFSLCGVASHWCWKWLAGFSFITLGSSVDCNRYRVIPLSLSLICSDIVVIYHRANICSMSVFIILWSRYCYELWSLSFVIIRSGRPCLSL